MVFFYANEHQAKKLRNGIYVDHELRIESKSKKIVKHFFEWLTSFKLFFAKRYVNEIYQLLEYAHRFTHPRTWISIFGNLHIGIR